MPKKWDHLPTTIPLLKSKPDKVPFDKYTPKSGTIAIPIDEHLKEIPLKPNEAMSYEVLSEHDHEPTTVVVDKPPLLNLPIKSMFIQYIVVPEEFELETYRHIFFVSVDEPKCQDITRDIYKQSSLRTRTVKLSDYLLECYVQGGLDGANRFGEILCEPETAESQRKIR